MNQEAERRQYPRSYIPFQVKVSGLDSDRKEFEDDAILHNISLGGLYMRIPHCVEPGTNMTFVVRFPLEGSDVSVGPRLPVEGTVLRVKPLPTGMCDVAVQFKETLQY